MAITIDDFNKIWASTSPLTPYTFSDANYRQGWNFVGATPPSRQMWDSIQKSNDEKSKFLYELAQMIVPIGVVQAFAGSTTPDGWLLCDGSAVSRTDYADLFAVIGSTYGDGDGSTTFNLPDLADKFIEGSATAGTVKDAALPNISGEVFILSANNYSTKISAGDSGAFYGSTSPATPMFNSTQSGGAPSTGTYNKLNISASSSSSVYKNGVTTVQPPAVTMRYIIKY